MSPPKTWMPPLNSHDAYTTFVSFIPFNAKEGFWRLTVRFIMNFHAVVEFTSPHHDKPFPGLYLKDTLYYSCRLITSPSFSSSSSSSYETAEILDDMFSGILLPFELDHIVFQHTDSVGTSHQKLNNFQDLATIIQNIIIERMKSQSNPTGILSFQLDILKSVVISDDEYEAWSSSYSEKRKADSNFVMEYMSAIFSTRTDEELLEEEEAFDCKTRAKTSNDTLHDGRIDSSKECLICMEELPPQSPATGLPCTHVFHRSCILKWLQESNTCPCCRFLLPSAYSP